jgi:hypothetical protein
MMKKKIVLFVVALATAMSFSFAKPEPARADAADIAIYSGIAAGVAIVIVLVATYFSRDEDELFLTEAPRDPLAEQAEGRTVKVGLDCQRPDGTMSLVCW